MINNNFSRGVELYSAPELEVISTIVEEGFTGSSFDDVESDDFGDLE